MSDPMAAAPLDSELALGKDDPPAPTVKLSATGWNRALLRWPSVVVKSLPIHLTQPRTFSTKVVPPKIRVKRFCFRPPALKALPTSTVDGAKSERTGKSNEGKSGSGTSGSGKTGASDSGMDDALPTVTRVKPPEDVIKLDDRLFYLLQPPLESMLSNGSLQMPFRPFPYQLTGISFLFPRHAAVVADEMGLGKTMQAITTMRLLLHAGQVRDILLVCPKPLVTNWQREFNLWAPEIPICVVEGDRQRREWQWGLAEFPVKIANYEALLRDQSIVGDGEKHFDLVVLDEAQRIKNRSSTSHQVVCSLSRTRSWALTGTPIENSPDDLVGIFEFVVPGYLSPGLSPMRLKEATHDFIVRRTKDQVLTDMPPKLNRDAHLGLTPEQADAYQRAEGDGVVQLKSLAESITIQHVFELVLRLKQICNFDPATGASAKADRLEADLEEVAASGKKAIIFSQWVDTLDQLKQRLRRFNPVEYHGRVPTKQRDGMIERLRNDDDCHVILMSYGAGSVGLNLQFCEYVFLFDRWWNPAIEDQAINRAHRIGAAGPVTVTRFVTVNSIEERIDQVLTHKREIFDAVLSDAGVPASAGLSQSDIFGLFDLKVPGGKLDVDAAAA